MQPTGPTRTASSWLHSVIVPAMLAVAEAGWASLLLGASFNGAHRPPVDLTFLVVALPAVAGVLLGATGSRLAGGWRPRALGAAPIRVSTATGDRGRWRRMAARWPQVLRVPAGLRPQVLILVPVAIVGMALTAGLISERSASGSLTRVAIQPWSSVGHRPAVVAGAAWFVAILAWVRGTWLGGWTLSFRHAAWSLVLAGAAYIGIFAGRTADHEHAFRAATGASGWLFFISFPLAAAAIALVHQRDLEREVLTRASSRPSGAWVGVLALPMAGIAAVGLLLAVVVGPAAPIVGRGAGDAAVVVWTGVRDAAVWLWDLIPRGHPNGKVPTLQPVPQKAPAATAHAVAAGHGRFTVPAIAGEVIGALLVLAVVVYLFRHVHFPRFARPAAIESDEERDSVFTWQHLWAQLRAAVRGLLRRLVPRRRRRPSAPSPASAGSNADDEVLARTVRDAYRHLLVAARRAGAPRREPETAQEMAGRFTGQLDADAAGHLRDLTGLYESVRYGGFDAGDPEHRRAVADADLVIPALIAALSPPEPPAAPKPTATP
jgi:Domain of unknown function (DUF4129)